MRDASRRISQPCCTLPNPPRARILKESASATVLYIVSLPRSESNETSSGSRRRTPGRHGGCGVTVTFEPGGMCRGAPRDSREGIEHRSLETGQDECCGRVLRGRVRNANDDEIDPLLARRLSMSGARAIRYCARVTNVSGARKWECGTFVPF